MLILPNHLNQQGTKHNNVKIQFIASLMGANHNIAKKPKNIQLSENRSSEIILDSLNFESNQVSNSTFLNDTDCNMDKIRTKIDLQGYIIYLDLSNFKSLSYIRKSIASIKMNYSQAKEGLLLDYNHLQSSKKSAKLKLFDYVHSNDINHIQKHINDGLKI